MTSGRSKSRKAASKRGKTKARTAAESASEWRSDGRLHLALVVDPASGRERLDLVRAVFHEDWQNRLTAAAANTAYAVLRDERSVDAVVRLGKSAMASTSTLVAGLLERAPAGSVACQAGCDHCCYQSVGVTPPEALAIHAHLLETRSASELEVLRRAIHSLATRTRGMSSEERVSPELPCPFLEGHSCTIYEARPLSCRGVNSIDAAACRQHLHDPGRRAASVAGLSTGHILLAPLRAMNAISAGLQLGLAERFGLDMRPLDLVFALELLLPDAPIPPEGEAPRSLGQRWLEREPALVPARGGDASGDPRRLEIVGAASSHDSLDDVP